MNPKKRIKGKRVLIVDDEKDVLDSLYELLNMCKIDTALTYEEGKRLLEENIYDIAILDIMGIRGFDLLEVANKRGVPALMLTAHALTEDALKKSLEKGAAYYAPKDKIANIHLFVADVIDALEMGKNPWVKMFERLSGFYDRKFGGTDWREKEKAFWEKRVKPIH